MILLGWTIGESLSKLGSLYSEGTADCPQNTGNYSVCFFNGTKVLLNLTHLLLTEFNHQYLIMVECSNVQPLI